MEPRQINKNFTHIIMLSSDLFSSCNLRRTKNCVSFGALTLFSRKFCRNEFYVINFTIVLKKIKSVKLPVMTICNCNPPYPSANSKHTFSFLYVPIEFFKMPRHTLVISRSDCKTLSHNNH